MQATTNAVQETIETKDTQSTVVVELSALQLALVGGGTAGVALM